MPYVSIAQRERIVLDGPLRASSTIIDLDPDLGPRSIAVRPVGFPWAYVRYSSARDKVRRAAGGELERLPGPHPFLDDGHPVDQRIGLLPAQAVALGVEECPYAARGYVPSFRWAMNALENVGDDVAVRVLDGPLALWELFWGFERANRERNVSKGHRRYVEDVGGAKSHLFQVAVDPPRPRARAQSPYRLEIGDATEITDGEIQALAEAGRPCGATLARLRVRHGPRAVLEKAPDWAFFGLPLWRMFAPHL